MTPERWRQIEQLYHAALEREPSQRAGFLAQACDGDEGLRHEVDSLLRQESALLAPPAVPGATVTSFTPGLQLGPYRIEGPLGVGGMGEVFRGIDTRLGRPVAIKRSHEQFSGRFEREARAISALNHPHICTLYDVGPNYLVMELVEGETLAARLKKGALPLDQAVRYGVQIADALAAAHDKAIVHRDLKPGNIMLAKSGVKVLDFGLAKYAQDDTQTASRAVLGTPAYMAPEQREAQVCDARTDIYALGLVLYEMATGQRPPSGQPAPLDALPPALAHVIGRCLERDPGDRWQTARDAGKELAWAGALRAGPAAKPASRIRWPVIAAVVAAAAAIGAVAAWSWRSPAAGQRVQFSLPFDAGAEGVYANLPRAAPDGSAIVYTATDSSGRRQLWLRELDSDHARALPDTDEALFPFWSPDGKWIGFYAQRKLKKVSRGGGNSQTIAAVAAFDGSAAWSATGEIVFAPGNRTALYRVSDSGGAPRELTKLDAARGENSHRHVRFLPDGRHFLFTARSANRDSNGLYAGDLSTGAFHRLGSIQSNTAFVPARGGGTGFLLFVNEGALYRQPFDGNTLSGKPERLMEVEYRRISLIASFDASMDGRVLVARPPSTGKPHLTWFDRHGANLGTLGPPGEFLQPSISPDGSRVIFNRPDDNGGNRDVWLVDVARGTAARLTTDPANEWDDLWAPDGRRVLFASDRNGHRDGAVWEKVSLDPGAGERPVEGLPDWANPQDLTADGRWLAFQNGVNHGEVWVAPLFGDRKYFRFVDSGFEDRQPRCSPDGKWIAYHSNESGRFEVYVRPFAGAPAESGRKIQVSLQGGFYATWSRDGKELYFLGPDSKLYAAAAKDLSTGGVSTPQALFAVCPGNTPTGSATQGRSFDVAPDGRFLFVCAGESDNRFTVTVNWQARP